MADAFKGVVILLVASGVFAQGLMSISAIDNLLSLADSAGAGGIALMLLLTALTVAAAIATGSGNAPLLCFRRTGPVTGRKNGIKPGIPDYPHASGIQPWPYDFSGFRRYCGHLRHG